LSDNPSPAGLFKQFEPIYRGIFRNRAASPDVGFLREEFIRFALLHWGNGVVPKKLLRHLTLTPETRYVTKSEFSKSFGICFQAMNRLIADRTIVTRKVTAGKGTRVVIDLVLSRLPVESTDVLNSCDAAKYLGLPVSVSRYLRGSGIFSTRPRLGHPASWHKDDLQDFMNLGLGLGGAECSGEVTVQLRDVMRLKLRNTAAKATIVAAVFERQIGVVSSVGSNLADLLLDKKQLDAFVLEKRMQIDGRTYSPSETAAQTGLDCQAVVGAIKRGLLSASEFNGRLRVPESAVKRFNADYITLSQVAKNLGTTAPLLWRICREKELPVVVVSRAHGRPDQPVLLRSAYPQLTEYLQANVRPRLRSKSQRNADEKCMLRDYLDNVRENDKTLPRRDGKPNKVVIARACGFTRDVLYSNSSAIALLEEFDMQERHQAGSDKAGPLGMLVKYLNTLRDSGGKLPRKRNHRPNILAIANAGNFSRRLFYRDTEAMSHLNAYASAENCTAIVQGWHHNQVS
jgi:hypothetical protein